MIRTLQQDSRLMKIIFAVIIGLAAITMVITLVPGIFDNAATGDTAVYATVREPGLLGRLGSDSIPIKSTEVNQLAQRQLQQQHLPDFLLPYMAQRSGQILVQRAILKHEADRMNLQVSDEDLRESCRPGRSRSTCSRMASTLAMTQYINFVQSAFQTTRCGLRVAGEGGHGAEPAAGADYRRRDVSDAAVREAYRTAGTKVKFDYAVISADELSKTINPSDAELQGSSRRTRRGMRVRFLRRGRLSMLRSMLRTCRAASRKFPTPRYRLTTTPHKDQYQVKEQVKVRHILIAVPAGADAKTDAAAKAKAEDLLKQIKAAATLRIWRSEELG
jgi:peptidyl-prolyl cis-trans isomerase D